MPWTVAFSSDSSDGEQQAPAAVDVVPPASADAALPPVANLTRAQLMAQIRDQTQRRRAPGGGRPRGSVGPRMLRQILQEQRAGQQAAAEAARAALPLRDQRVAQATNARLQRAQQQQQKQQQLDHQPHSSNVLHLLSTTRHLSSVCDAICKSLHRQGSSKHRTQQVIQRLLRLADRSLLIPPTWVPLHMEALMMQADRRGLPDDKIALSSLLFSCSRMIWSSFLSWLLIQLQSKQ